MFPLKEYFSEKNKQLRQSHFASFCFEIALVCALLRCRLSVRGVWWHRFLWKFNPFVTSPGDLRDLGRPFRYEARRSPGLIA